MADKKRKTPVNKIVFEEPPPKGVNTVSGRRRALLEELKDHPGRWASIVSGLQPISALAVVRGYEKGESPKPAGNFEFRASGDKVFARFLREDEDDAA